MRGVGRFYPDFLRFQDDKSLQANILFYCPVDFITRGIAFICYVLLFYALFLPDSNAHLGKGAVCHLITSKTHPPPPSKPSPVWGIVYGRGRVALWSHFGRDLGVLISSRTSLVSKVVFPPTWLVFFPFDFA